MYPHSYCLLFTSFLAMSTDSLAVPSLSLRVYQCNKTWCAEFLRAKLFLHHYVLFQLAQLFIRGNSRYLFPNRWNWEICHIHRAFKIPLCTISCELQTFPSVKSKTNWISSEMNLTVHFSSLQKYSVWVTYGKQAAIYPYAAYSRVAGTCYPTWCTWL